MYNERERSHFFRDLIVKVLLVLLFIFLLMWLFPIPNLNPFYDKIFTQNINNMTDAAKAYYTIARLPEKEGESKKLTLGDMINNKMLIEFTDSNGKTCDKDASYVEVTKKDKEYIFKTNLSCSTGEDYVIEYFGCYNVCQNGSCNSVIENVDSTNKEKTDNKDSKKDNNGKSNTVIRVEDEEVGVAKGTTNTKKVTEYQFSKTIKSDYIDKYSCKSGYKLEGTKCVKETTISSEKDASIKCLEGYTYNTSTKKCEKEVETTSNPMLNCPKGYIYATSTKQCIKGTDNEVDAEVSYKCTTGTLSGTKCIIDGTKEVDAEVSYKCAEGTRSGTKCVIKTTKEVDAEVSYKCAEGTRSGTKCVINITKEVDAAKEYSCKEGTRSGTKCIIEIPKTCDYTKWVCSNRTYATTMSIASTTTFTRRFLYPIGNSFVYEECNRTYSCIGGGTKEVDAEVSYKCAEGTRSGTKCIIKTTKEVDAAKEYSCKEGTRSGTKCVINITKEVDAAKEYSCKEGTRSGTKCIVKTTSTKDATKVYSCTVGTLNGTKCEIKGIDRTEATYTCKYGTLQGNKCVVVTKEEKDPIYYCASNQTLVGTKCYSSKSTTDIIDATPIYKTKTQTVYKWSTSEQLNGWTRTGKTRTTNIAITSRG